MNFASDEGFFGWLAATYDAAYVIIECKNYTGEAGNPELDQLSGRYSPGRGRFGLLLCRSFDDKPNFIARCRDTANDGRGWIIALDDGDLRALVEAREEGDRRAFFLILKDRFNELIM